MPIKNRQAKLKGDNTAAPCPLAIAAAPKQSSDRPNNNNNSRMTAVAPAQATSKLPKKALAEAAASLAGAVKDVLEVASGASPKAQVQPVTLASDSHSAATKQHGTPLAPMEAPSSSTVNWDQLLAECQSDAQTYGRELEQLRREIDSNSEPSSGNSNGKNVDGSGKNVAGSVSGSVSACAEDSASLSSTIVSGRRPHQLLPEPRDAVQSELPSLRDTTQPHAPYTPNATTLSVDERAKIASIVEQLEAGDGIAAVPKVQAKAKVIIDKAPKTSIVPQATSEQQTSVEVENQRLRVQHIKALEDLSALQEHVSTLNKRALDDFPRKQHLAEVNELRMRLSRLGLELNSLHEQNDILRQDNRRLVEEELAVKHVLSSQREIHSNNRVSDLSKQQLVDMVQQHLERLNMQHSSFASMSDAALPRAINHLLRESLNRIISTLDGLSRNLNLPQEQLRSTLVFDTVTAALNEMIETHGDLVGAFVRTSEQLHTARAGIVDARKYAEEAVLDVMNAKTDELEQLKQRVIESRIETETSHRQLKAFQLQMAGRDAELESVHSGYEKQLQDMRTTLDAMKQAMAEKERSFAERERTLQRELQKQKTQRLFNSTPATRRPSSRVRPVSSSSDSEKDDHREASRSLSPHPRTPAATDHHNADQQGTVNALRLHIANLEGSMDAWREENETLRAVIRESGRDTPAPLLVPTPEPTHQATTLIADLNDALDRNQGLVKALKDARSNNDRLIDHQDALQRRVRQLEEEEHALRMRLVDAQRQSPSMTMSPLPQPLRVPQPQVMSIPQPIYIQQPVTSDHALHALEHTVLERLESIQQKVSSMEGPLEEVVDRLTHSLQAHDIDAVSSTGKIETLVHRWQELLRGDDGNLAAVGESIERLVERATKLKQERDDFAQELHSLREQLQQQERDSQTIRLGEESTRRMLQDKVDALQVALAAYEKQFAHVLSVSSAATPASTDTSDVNGLPLLDESALSRGLQHPLPFLHHITHAASSAIASNHALLHLKAIAEQEKARADHQRTRMEALEQELKYAMERADQFRSATEKEGRESKTLQTALQEVRREYESSAERNAVLESKLLRIGEGFQRILL